MGQTKKRSVSLIVAMILVAMFVLGGLFIFYWWTLNRGGVYAEKAMTAAAERDWDGAYAFAAKAERYGEPDMNKAITYEKAAALSEDGSYAEAKELYSGLKGYRDADEQVLACIYGLAEQAQSRGALEAARDGFLSARTPAAMRSRNGSSTRATRRAHSAIFWSSAGLRTQSSAPRTSPLR